MQVRLRLALHHARLGNTRLRLHFQRLVCCRVVAQASGRVTLTHPRRERRTDDQVSRALGDCFLAVQRHMVQELCDQHLGQQARSGDEPPRSQAVLLRLNRSGGPPANVCPPL